MKNTLKYEDYISLIDIEIKKRKNKWFLSRISGIDFDDVSQIIKIHIFKKWHLYNPKKKIEPWINTIISNQIKNLIRNNYGNYSKPCVKCNASMPDSKCEIYIEQCADCPLYAKWQRTKEQAFNLKSCQSTEENQNHIINKNDESFSLESNIAKINQRIPFLLKENEFQFYQLFYLEKNSEEEIARKMKFKTCEKNRKPGYKQIQNLKKSIIKKIKKAIFEDKIDII